MAGNISPSLLLGWFQSFYGGRGTGASTASIAANGGAGTTAPPILYAPTPPWDASLAQPSQSHLVNQAESGAQLFNPSAAKLDLVGASADYKKLFALYSGLNSLFALAKAAGAANVSSLQLGQLNQAFANGWAQLQTYLSQTSFSKLTLAAGTLQTSQTSTATTPQQAASYVTPALNTTGDSSAVVPAFQGNVQFNITVEVNGTTKTIPIDLSGMGTTPRTIGNVVAYLNSQLQAGGAIASFSAHPIAATPDTIQVGGKTVTLGPGKTSWALQLNTNPFETVTLSAPAASNAVYVGQIVGNQASSTSPTGATVPPDAQSQLLKFATAGGVSGPSTPANAAPDQVFTQQLGAGVSSVQATATSPDGSVYVLANVTKTTAGTAPVGGQDVALQKYDSAGHLLFSTDLGSVSSASGLSLAVSADGSQVAVAGQVTGSLTAGQTVNDPTGGNSFVAVFDSQGEQAWKAQDDGATPNKATGVAFAADGSVYVTGQSQTSANPGGPTNSYLQVFSPAGVQVSDTQIASGGPNTSAGVAVDGSNVYVAGVQNGDAVVNEYDLSNPAAPSLVATRDLGNLQGGNVAGIAVQNGQVYVAGDTHNGALSAGTITSAASGTGLNAFAAQFSTGLAPAAGDSIAYYGGSGDTRVTAVTVSGGDVWIAGSVTGSLPNEPAIGAQDGFIAALNPATGAVDSAQRFTGLDGQVAPTSIAVAATGASVLDQMGLPQGVVDGPVSDLVTANTAVKAGDSFQISTNGGAPTTITVQADDTFSSLATRIAQATGFNVDVTAAPAAGGATALEIKPASLGITVKLIDGPAGTDALAELGLKPGVVAETSVKHGVTVLAGGGALYGLGLPASLDLGSAAAVKTAQVQLAGALSVVENAYQNLKTAATPAAVLALQKAQAKGGGVPSYLSNQIANYQSALQRLTAGQAPSSGIASLFG